MGRRDGGGHPSSPIVIALWEEGVAAWLKLRNRILKNKKDVIYITGFF
jgi:hypothetical protein